MAATIGIDASLRRTGFAKWDTEEGFSYRAVSPPKTLVAGRRLAWFYHYFEDLLCTYSQPIAGAAIEGYSYGSHGRLAQLGELGGVFRVLLAQHCGAYVVVAPSQLKKFMTGKGGGARNVTKQNMILAANRLLTEDPLAPHQDDEADAIGLAHVARNIFLDLNLVDAQQRDIVDQLRRHIRN